MKPPILTVQVEDILRRNESSYQQRVLPGPYSHTISAFGGFDTASFTLNTTQTEAENWLEHGIMRHVAVYGSALDIVWEGFLNELRVTVGPLTVTHGPFLDMANRVSVLYTPQVLGGVGAVSGSQTITADADGAESQVLYGVQPVVLSSGATTDAQAIKERDQYLLDNKWPKTTERLSSSANRPVTVRVGCKGYQHLLNWPYYDDTAGTSYAHVKLAAVLAASPNAVWLDYGTSYIETNNLDVRNAETDYRPAITIIKEIVAAGGATNDLRWLFQVLENRYVYYKVAPTSVDYMARVSGRGLVIHSAEQAVIDPWRLRPGYWLSLDDFMVGRDFPALTIADDSLHRDPRLMFLEKVSYRAPFGLQVAGGNTDEINQLLAKYGLEGMPTT